MSPSPSAVTVLLVEDDAVEVMAVERAFKKKKIANPVVVAKDGIEALAILRAEDGRAPLQRPFLILLDLNMPRMNGIEFLHQIRSDDQLSNTVVFVLTTSKADEDRTAAYREHVAGYIVKANVGNDFVEVITLLDAYWRIVELP